MNNNNEQTANITTEKVLTILRKHLVPIIAAALVFFAGAYGYMKLFVAPSYYAEAKFYIESSTNKGTSGDVTTTRLLAETFVEILNTNSFFKTVLANLPDGVREQFTASSLKSACSFTIQNSTEVVLIRFTSANEKAVVPVITAILSSMQPHLDVAYGECSCHIVDVPENALVSSSMTKTVCAIALAGGAFAAFMFFMLKDMLDIHVRGADDIASKYNIPIIGTVPSFGKKDGGSREASGYGK